MYAVIKNEKTVLVTPYLAKARIAADGRHPCQIFQFMEDSVELPRWSADRFHRMRELEGQTVNVDEVSQ